jgi:hypothetical protein
MPRAFDIDEMNEEQSENEKEAYAYLHDVRQQLRNAPKFT